MIKTPSIISNETMIAGDLKCSSAIEIEGKVIGNVYCELLSIKKSGTVTGNVQANCVTIGGEINGNIKAKNVKILKSSIIKGDIFYLTLIAESGCVIEGKIQKVDPKNENFITLNDKEKNIVVNSDKKVEIDDNKFAVLEEESQ